jgi:putative CRISPR-associated protein (TIGR02619 family)
MISYLKKTDPVKASAEMNCLSRLLAQSEDRTQETVALLHSETTDGALCAVALREHLEREWGCKATLHPIIGLTYSETRFVERGLRSLVQTLAHLLHHARRNGQAAIINATGGFKAEIAYATLVGLLFDVPVCYIHEAFREIVTLPATPVGWDLSLIFDYRDFFDWLDEEPRETTIVQQRMAGIPVAIQALVEHADDGYSYLSAMGEAYFAAFRDRESSVVQTPLYLSPSALAEYEKGGYDRILRGLQMPTYRINPAKVKREPKSDCLIFPRGQYDERAFFVEDGDGMVYILELIRHGPRYDELLRRGVLRDRYIGLVTFTPVIPT